MHRQKDLPGQSQAGQTNILTPVNSDSDRSKCEVSIKSQRMMEGLRDLGRINYIFRTMGSWEGYEDPRGRSWECGSWLTSFLSSVWSHIDNLDPFKFLQTQ